jgi:hypothetical protein
MLFSRISLVCTLCLVLIPGDIQSAEVNKAFFDNTYRQTGITLPLRGTGLLKYLLFIDAYVAALYIQEEVPAEDALGDVPKRLEIHYFHAIKAEDFAASTNKLIADNQDPETVARLAPKMDAINNLYVDVRPGDRYALTYTPGKGTELSFNGVTRGIIPGREFAAAIFSIWLGSKPIDKELKKQLLGAP